MNLARDATVFFSTVVGFNVLSSYTGTRLATTPTSLVAGIVAVIVVGVGSDLWGRIRNRNTE